MTSFLTRSLDRATGSSKVFVSLLLAGALSAGTSQAAPPAMLSVTPASGLDSSGIVGGPFAPAQCEYTLSNASGPLPLDWTAAATQSWVALSKTGGTLDPGATDSITVSIGGEAGGLPAGSYSDTVTFTNTTNGNGNTSRSVTLSVLAPWDCFVDPINGNDLYDGRKAVWDGTHGPKQTIQAGIDSVIDGCRVILAPGTYIAVADWIRFNGKAITVQSTNPADPAVVQATVFDCLGGHYQWRRAFWFDQETSASVLAGITIRNGWWLNGGAIYCTQASPVISHCRFIDNVADRIPPWATNEGAAIECENGSPSIRSCEFLTNASSAGVGGAVCLKSTSNAVISDCLFAGNSAGVGGGVSLYGTSNTVISDCLFAGNTADVGAAIRAGYCTDTGIIGCTFAGNEADAAEEHACIYVYPGTGCEISDCILWNEGPYGGSVAGSGVAVSYCDILGGYAGGINIINVDPLFVDAAGGNYRLQASSACINAGDPAFVPSPGETDLDGGPRIRNARVDMGAYEHVLVGDVNGDGHVDVSDLLAMARSWSKCKEDVGFDPHCDLNGDGCVDAPDLLLLAGAFGM